LKENTNCYLHTGVLVKSPMGAKGISPYSLNDPNLDTLFASGSVYRKLRYFNVPILIRYQFGKRIFIELGPNLGLLNKANDVFLDEVKDKDDLSFTVNTIDQYNRLDIGVMGGMGYKMQTLHGMNFGVRYYQGLRNLTKDKPDKPNYNSSLYIFVSLPIGAGEQAQAKAAEKKKARQEKKAAKQKEK